MNAVEKAHQILSLARSRQTSDRDQVLLSLTDLCEAGLAAGGRLEPEIEPLVAGILTDLVAKAASDIRQQLAERLAGAEWPPKALIALLARDEIEIARPVIASSPLLDDTDLAALIAAAGLDHQIEVARRPGVGAAVVDLLIALREPAVLTALVDNDTAQVSALGMSRLVDMSRDFAAIRSPLVRHPRLTLDLAERLYAWVGESLRAAIAARFKVDPEKLMRAVTDAVLAAQAPVQWAAVSQAGEQERREMERQLVQKLNAAGQLKPGYVLRALREQRLSLFTEALGEMAGVKADAIKMAIDRDRPELLALACTAAGFDRSLFPTVLALVRQLNNGRPLGEGEAARRTMRAFAVHEPAVAAAALRQALERLDGV